MFPSVFTAGPNRTRIPMRQLEPPLPEKYCVELLSRAAVPHGHLLYLILYIKDNVWPGLITYRQVVIQTTNEKLRDGGGGAEAMEIPCGK